VTAVRTLVRYFVVVVLAATGLVVAVVAVAPAARALLTAGHSSGHDDVASALADLPERSIVYAADGTVLDVLHAAENRSPISFDQVPSTVVAAVVDTEDDQFWNHHGVNLQATARALVRDAQGGQVTQGGSTITQQLIKNTLLTSERSVSRKLKEAVLAERLETELSKKQILERYLNTVYFGNGAYGIQAAAETYFGEDVSKLTTVQGAFLAGMIRDPYGYDPFRFRVQSRARRNFVLDRMVARRDLTRAQADELATTPLPTAKIQAVQPDNIDSYFTEEVKQRLLEDPRLGPTAQARYNALFRGGLSIYTTLDPKMQAAAKQAVADNLPADNGKWTTALVSVEPSTGAVKALIGGSGFDQSQYRIASEGVGRQPGSSFKPIVLATALANGYSPWAGVDGSSPCSFYRGAGKYYTPSNNEGEQVGYTNLTNALALSVNCAYARLGLTVGLSKVVEMGKQLGITSPLAPLPSMSLGAEEARPIDMAGVYATFANEGVFHRPFLVQRVVDRTGKVLLSGGDKGTQVLSVQVARELTQALRAVVQYGTGTSANLFDRQVAGKTGTSENNANAWFDGYTPQLATVVWMGSPIGNVAMYSVGGKTAAGNYEYYRTVYGATYPALIWREFMKAALQGQPSIDFVKPNQNELGTITYVRNPNGSYTSGGSYPPTTIRRRTTTTVGGSPPSTVSGAPPPSGPPTTPPKPPPTEPPAPTATTTP
jgi:penicillin-binding protein 1A